MVTSTPFLDRVDSASRAWANLGVLGKIILACFFLLNSFLVGGIVFVAGLPVMPRSRVGKAAFETACGASHHGLIMACLVDLTRATVRTKTHGEIWEVAKRGNDGVVGVSGHV